VAWPPAPALATGDTLRFEGPLGDFTLRASASPILFVAGATGFAPIKSIVEDAFARGLTRPMWLYWGVRRRADLYARALAEQWQREHAQFHFVPVLSEPDAADLWHGRTGLVHQAILADFADLSGHEVLRLRLGGDGRRGLAGLPGTGPGRELLLQRRICAIGAHLLKGDLRGVAELDRPRAASSLQFGLGRAFVQPATGAQKARVKRCRY
jgi:hypothetical protein